MLTLYFSKSEDKKRLSPFQSWRSGSVAIKFRNLDLFTGEWNNFICSRLSSVGKFPCTHILRAWASQTIGTDKLENTQISCK
jgi:hypothetical protein